MWCLLFPQGHHGHHHHTIQCPLQIAEEVEIQLQNYKTAVAEINKRATAPSPDAAQQEGTGLETQNLMAAVSSLPELTEKKKVLDKHTSIATTLLGIIKDRSLFNTCNLLAMLGLRL